VLYFISPKVRLFGVDQRYTAREVQAIVRGGDGRMPAFKDLSNDEVAAVAVAVQKKHRLKSA
jgi:mono/diheme cytochrome c family protein